MVPLPGSAGTGAGVTLAMAGSFADPVGGAVDRTEGAAGACTGRGGVCVGAGLILVGAAAGRCAPTGVAAAGAIVAGLNTAESALSRTGFVPATVFSAFGTLLSDGFAG